MSSALGRSHLISVAVGAAAGLGLLGLMIYKRVSKRTAPTGRDGPAQPLVPPDAQQVALEQQALGLSPEQQQELRIQMDEVLRSVAWLHGEVAELWGGMQDMARMNLDRKKSIEDNRRAQRRQYIKHRQDTGSASSTSLNTSEGGYSTALAESDFTDQEVDDKVLESEDDEDQSCNTVLTLRQEDSQEEEEEEVVEVEEVEQQYPAEPPSGELALLLAQVDILHMGDARLREDGFQLLLANRPQYGDNREFLWRLARAYCDMYQCTKDMQERKIYTQQAREEAEAALMKNGLNAECHKWFAVLSGLTLQHESTHGKLKGYYILKKHLDRAIALRDDDALCFYLLGRWCFEASSHGWLEKKAAAVMYDNATSCTLQDALENFLRAEELNPGFSKTMRLYIAKCYKELGNLSEARNWVQLALKAPATANHEDDSAAELEAELRALTDQPADELLY